jgi:hypothetical protein
MIPDKSVIKRINPKTFDDIGVSISLVGNSLFLRGTPENLHIASEIIDKLSSQVEELSVEISKAFSADAFKSIASYFYQKYGVRLEQREGDSTSIVLQDCTDVKLKVALMRLMQRHVELDVPTDWSDVFA